MSMQSQIGKSVSELVSFIKEKTVENVAMASKRGIIEIGDKELNGVIGIVESSISQAFSTGYFNVESTVKSIEQSIEKKSKTTTRSRSRKK